MFKKIICKVSHHRWDRVHGNRDAPEFGATCLRCGATAITKAEWERRVKL